MKKTLVLILLATGCGLFSLVTARGAVKDADLVLIYTGETHAALYPCNCPVEQDGGVARRATLIEQLKKEHPDALVLDSGNFFSSGLFDQNTQSARLDMQRAKINLAAMGLMKYDAVNLSDDEFNFGKDFLKENIDEVKLDFISSNLVSDMAKPYLIKEAAGIKVGIIGLTSPLARQKDEGLKFIEPGLAVEKSVRELKEKGAGLIILLSNLGESEDAKIIAGVPGISVLIEGHGRGNTASESFNRAGDTVILRPNWQGRRLGKAVLSLKGGKIGKTEAEELRLSDKISDDPAIRSILPRCFSDNNCRKGALQGTCRNAATLDSACLFREPVKFDLTVITSKDCSVCKTEPAVDLIKRYFPGANAVYLDYHSKEAGNLLKGLKVESLPVYFLGKEAAKDENFENFRPKLQEEPGFYLLKPEAGGVTYFLKRKPVKGRLDLFLSLYDKDSFGLLSVIREFNPVVHFLAIVKNGKIDAYYGEREAEEDLRAVCVQKYYPLGFWDYIACRSKKIESTWWEECAPKMDLNRIRGCARSPEGEALLKENTGLAGELKIMFGPAYLLDNNQIFASKGTPSKEELKKIIKR